MTAEEMLTEIINSRGDCGAVPYYLCNDCPVVPHCDGTTLKYGSIVSNRIILGKAVSLYLEKHSKEELMEILL